MPRGKLSRRGFLAASFASLTALTGLPAWYVREILKRGEVESALDAIDKRRRKVAASDRIALGAIGVGGQGYRLMIEAPKKRPDVELVAACDVDADCLAEAIAKSRIDDVASCRDFRDLLARPDIDAVTIAVPDHWHALIAIAAMKAGKDVYCEKPLTLTIDEGKILREVGAIDRPNPPGWLAPTVRCLRSSRLRLGPNGGSARSSASNVWLRIEPQAQERSRHRRPPRGLDCDFWLGQTPKVDYVKERCRYNFRWWYEYSGGKLTDWGAHHNDIAQWALGMDGAGPVAIEAEGGPVGLDRNGYSCPSISG